VKPFNTAAKGFKPGISLSSFICLFLSQTDGQTYGRTERRGGDGEDL